MKKFEITGYNIAMICRDLQGSLGMFKNFKGFPGTFRDLQGSPGSLPHEGMA